MDNEVSPKIHIDSESLAKLNAEESLYQKEIQIWTKKLHLFFSPQNFKRNEKGMLSFFEEGLNSLQLFESKETKNECDEQFAFLLNTLDQDQQKDVRWIYSTKGLLLLLELQKSLSYLEEIQKQIDKIKKMKTDRIASISLQTQNFIRILAEFIICWLIIPALEIGVGLPINQRSKNIRESKNQSNFSIFRIFT